MIKWKFSLNTPPSLASRREFEFAKHIDYINKVSSGISAIKGNL